MSQIIPADVQERVNALLGTGRYASEEEILRAAVAVLEERNADLGAIQAGIEDMENGRYRPFADFDAEFRQRNQLENDTWVSAS
jgi:Arc/MetJ-type ribon-helix-helix transcriptional regulator